MGDSLSHLDDLLVYNLKIANFQKLSFLEFCFLEPYFEQTNLMWLRSSFSYVFGTSQPKINPFSPFCFNKAFGKWSFSHFKILSFFQF